MIYFAGGENPTHKESLAEYGAKNILCSAWGFNKYRKKMEGYERFDNILMDSGGYTARMKGIEVDVESYAHFLNLNDIKLAFNLDVLDEKTSDYNQKFLEEETNAYIVPVYHYSDYNSKKHRHLIDKMIEKYPYISLGGIAGEHLGSKKEVFYDYAFKKIAREWDKCKVHGLGITSKRVLMRYPFYSVDSISWLSFQKHGQSRTIKNKLLVKFHNKETHYLKRNSFEIEYYKDMEKYITELWDKRGVSWNE